MPDPYLFSTDRSKLADDIEEWRGVHEPRGGGETQAWWIVMRLLMLILHRLDDGR